MLTFLSIALGGALGALTRYGIGLAITSGFGGHFHPVATLLVNIAGSGAMGLCYVLLNSNFTDPTRAFIMVGFLGSLTTFSAFSQEAITLLERGQTPTALAYIATSILLSLLAFWSIMTLTRHLVGH